MRIAILEPYNKKTLNKSQAIDAHLRNSIVLSDYLKADLLTIEKEYISAVMKGENAYDCLILGYGSHYAPFALINKLIENSPDAVKISIMNEYNVAPTIGGFSPFHLITNYEQTEHNWKNMLSYHTINLNLLIAGEPNKKNIQKKYDCIYYGTYRPKREKYFKEYLKDEIYLSTSSRNFKKYKHIGCTPVWINKLSWLPRNESLNLFKYSLYIEDEPTHTLYNHLANRYYEARKCNCIILFDQNCMNTIERSELKPFKSQVQNYIVTGYDDMLCKIKNMNLCFNDHLSLQNNWIINISHHHGLR